MQTYTPHTWHRNSSSDEMTFGTEQMRTMRDYSNQSPSLLSVLFSPAALNNDSVVAEGSESVPGETGSRLAITIETKNYAIHSVQSASLNSRTRFRCVSYRQLKHVYCA